ncbi:MAG: O-antigen ligase family protein, partial [Actinomycetota bacterium]|nr:O-antigen ligase family protein [Actinomycetota bacterium]
MSVPTAAPERRLSGRLPPLPRPRVDNRLLTVGLGLLVAALGLSAAGGSALGRVTLVEVVLLLGGGVVIACAALVAVRPRRLWGVWSLSLLLLLAALTAVSIAWSINPADSWLEANRGFAYAAVFAAAVAVAHVAPHRWQALVGGLLLGMVLVCAYSLATKVLPGLLAQDEIYARLRAPFGYWNAVGIAAAMAVPACLWLGTRRHGHAAVSALAFPAMGIVLTTLLLSYSRGALIAVAVGCALWFVLVPLRLRGAVVLATGLVVALFTALWTFGQAGLAQDEVELALRADAGLSFGLLLAAGIVVLTVSGMAIGFAAAAHPPQPRLRRRAGLVTLCAVAMIPVGVLGALAASQGGIGGAVSSAVESVTADTVAAPSNDPSRLLETESLRGLYWTEALDMFADNPVGGLGAGGYATARPRYGPDPIVTRYAHGFGFQALADLGLVGGALTVGLFITWLLAATRATGLRRGWRALPFTPERVGLITLLAIVVTFGVQSTIDWTWVFPGVAVIALLAAGWLAGRGPFTETPPARAHGAVGAIPERLRTGVR